MKHRFCFVLLIFTFSFFYTSAQQNHFIYFQTENRQPFYVKLDNKIYSSTSSGYLILPKLKDGDYTFKFGSSKNQWPEQTVNYKLNKDAGYSFKNLGEKGYGFVNLQSSEVITTGNAAPNNAPVQETRDDDFSKMLANVVNDSTIQQKDIVVKEKVNEVNDTLKKVEAAPAKIEAQEPAEKVAEPALNSIIRKRYVSKTKEGTQMVYTDEYNNKKDTIKIFIPVENNNTSQTKQKPLPIDIDSSKISSPADSNKVGTGEDTTGKTEPSIPLNQSVIVEEKKDTRQIVAQDTNQVVNNDSTQPPVRDTTPSIVTNDSARVVKDTLELVKDTITLPEKENKATTEDKIDLLPAQSGVINQDCKAYANEDDFFKLRKKMVSEKNEDGMINVAKKIFKTKCFTTQYIKNLSTLFLNDSGKYNFFDAAYPYVSDTGTFTTLQYQLSDTYYINRFKAMIH